MIEVEFPKRPADVNPVTWAQMRGIHFLEHVWAAFAEASDELRATINVPICVENCGLCCATNTPAAWGIEVVRAASWLLEQSPTVREKILDRIEQWLVRPVLEVEPPIEPSFTIEHPSKGKAAPGEKQRIIPIEVLACQRGRCPLLGEDLRCTVYPVRPLGCRSFGVTTQPPDWCKRPQGMGESPTTRATFSGDGTARLRALIRLMHDSIKDQPKLTNTALFPTALYAYFRPNRIMELLPNIPTARLTGGQNVHMPKLFDEALTDTVPIQVMD